MSADIATAIGTVIAAFIALAALMVSVAALSSQRASSAAQGLAFLTDIRREWERLREDWASVVLLWDPGFWYYSDAQPEERDRIQTLQRQVIEQQDWTDKVENLRAESLHVRRVTRYFAYVADALFRGRLSVSEIYAVFGPEVVRLRPAVVWAAGHARENATAMPTQIDQQWLEASSQIPNSSFYAEQSDVMALIDVLSGEMARLGDTRAHYLLMRAEELRAEHGGKLSRRNIRQAVRRRRKPLRALKMSRRARFSERVPLRAIAREPQPLLREEWSAHVRSWWLLRGLTRRRYKALMRRRAMRDLADR